MPSRRRRKRHTITKNATRNAFQLDRLAWLDGSDGGTELAAGREVKTVPDGTSTSTEVAVVPNTTVVVTLGMEAVLVKD